MHEARTRHSTRPHQTGAGNLGLLAGVTGMAVGAAWFLRRRPSHHSRASSVNSPLLLPNSQSPRQQSGRNYWWLGALGAGIAGALLHSKGSNIGGKDVRLTSHVTINRSPEEVYQYWRDLKNLPKVMSFIERVEPRGANIFHWVARGPAGPTIEWDAEVVDDNPGRLLAWRSLEGSKLQTWGTVTFTPRDENRRTEVSVAFNLCPQGTASAAIARFLGGLESTVLHKNLKDLKSQLEAGEVPTSRRYRKGKEPTGKGQTL